MLRLLSPLRSRVTLEVDSLQQVQTTLTGFADFSSHLHVPEIVGAVPFCAALSAVSLNLAHAKSL